MEKINVPKIGIDLEEIGLINQDLVQIKGQLAKRYTDVLKDKFDIECDLTSFRIDRRGMSPEVAEFVKDKNRNHANENIDYLSIGTNRYMVIISPDQREAPLMLPQTSFEDELINKVLKKARVVIEELTQNEPLIGEMDDRVEIIHSIDDILNINSVSVTLDTPSETLPDMMRLAKMSQELDLGTNALSDKYIGRMRELIEKVGDVRGKKLDKIFPIKQNTPSFYTSAIKGVHCFRELRNRDRKALVIYNDNTPNYHDQEEVTVLERAHPEVIDMLRNYKFTTYDKKDIDLRRREIEDELFLSHDIDIVELSSTDRKKAMHRYKNELPDVWKELATLKRTASHSRKKFPTIMVDASYEAKVRLAKPRKQEAVVHHLLSELDPTNLQRLYEHNRIGFLREFDESSKYRKRYIAHTMLQNTHGGKK